MNIKTIFPIVCLCMITTISFAQGKLNRDQLLSVIRSRHNTTDTTAIVNTDTIKSDARTTSISLTVTADSLTKGYSYTIDCNKEGIDLSISNDEGVVFRSSYDYSKFSFYSLKTKLNKKKLRRVKSKIDSCSKKEDFVLRLYRGSKIQESIECIGGITNVSANAHDLANIIEGLVPNIPAIISEFCSTKPFKDSIAIDTVKIEMTINNNTLEFKAKGGEFKKVKVNCNVGEWYVEKCPDWLSMSLNKDNEIIFESKPNETSANREADVFVICRNKKENIHVFQSK